MLQAIRVGRDAYRDLFGVDVVDEHDDLWRALLELGWVEITPDSLMLVGDGVFYTPLIQALLARGSGR